ncbi:hypothetical protein EVAR_100098_1 [Eumeta japonica]|uniref:RNA-directed DNA polymerase from mobile element jockey n=1 Tax=Eumeta variegata TaxID=151549 RepID=A0A4C1YS95_EUMVA|nr:hypothetical protein EVAR_100098_1 [Eumeta japonica]
MVSLTSMAKAGLRLKKTVIGVAESESNLTNGTRIDVDDGTIRWPQICKFVPAIIKKPAAAQAATAVQRPSRKLVSAPVRPETYEPVPALKNPDNTLAFENREKAECVANSIEKAIDELRQWFQLWRLEVNSDKSAAIYLDFSNIKRILVDPYNAPTLLISNASIPWQHNYKYLRITLDKHLYFRDHIQRVRKLAIFYMSRLSSMIAAASYEASPANNFLRRPRKALLDPPDYLTAESTFNGLTPTVLSAHRRHLKVPTRVVTLRDSLYRGDPNGSPSGVKSAPPERHTNFGPRLRFPRAMQSAVPSST